MVVALGPGKFYGSSLPRPRFYTDVKYSSERVDPPLPVLDPFLSWANDAHWSMGGLSFTRHRLQGRIEGNIKKLRTETEKILKKRKKEEIENPIKEEEDRPFIRSPNSVSPPLAPRATKQRRRLALVDEDSEPEEFARRRKPARKLGDDFDKVASEKMVKEKRKLERSNNEDGVENRGSPLKKITDHSPSSLSTMAYRTRSRKSEKGDVSDEGLVEPVEKANGSSSNPRSKKRKIQGGNKTKTKTNGEKGSPANANGIRTSPRSAKFRLNC